LCFWKFSRNRLADIQSRQATYAIFVVFWVPEMEPPGGTTLPARRRLVVNPISRFWLELPGGEEQLPGDANLFLLVLVCFGFWVNSDWRES